MKEFYKDLLLGTLTSVVICCFVTIIMLMGHIETHLDLIQGQQNQISTLQEYIYNIEEAQEALKVEMSSMQEKHDFIAAATRMGWGQAYNFIRSAEWDLE